MNRKIRNFLLVIGIICIILVLVFTIAGIFATFSTNKAESLCFISVSTLFFILLLKCIKTIKNKPFKNEKLIKIISVACCILIILSFPKQNKTKPSENVKIEKSNDTKENSKQKSSNINALKKELKDKYGIEKPSVFVKGDKTGKWKLVRVANNVPPVNYAVEYAKAYMNDGDIHFIVNFQLNTTTMIRLSMGIVEAKTTEYIKKEEFDATIIGSGQLYTDQYFYLESGKEVNSDPNNETRTVSSSELVSKVKEAIEGSVGNNEQITNVEFDGKNLLINVDISETDTKILSLHDIALSRISSITDSILELDAIYYNTWNTITIDFGKEGKAILNKSFVKNQGFGKFFDFSDDILKQN